MKALLCRQHGGPSVLKVEEMSPPSPGEGEARIAVRAVGVNFPDVLLTAGKYQLKPDFPFSPGNEAAGEVLEVGPGVSHVKPGDRVIAMTGLGAFREEIVAEADKLLSMPESMSYEHGAAFPVNYGTSYHALQQRARLQPGEVLVVHGAGGGVGLTAVELGKLMGARVIATAGSDEKLEIAKTYGAEVGINYSREKIRDRVKELTDGNGADVIYDPVGGDVMDESVRCINWNGRILVIGFAGGRIAEVPSNLLLLKGCALVGVFWGSFTRHEPERSAANFRTLLGWYAEGKLKPYVSHVYQGLEEAPAAMQALIDRQVISKVVVRVSA